MAKLLYSAGEAGAAHPGGTGCQIEGHGVYLCSISPHFFLAFSGRGGIQKEFRDRHRFLRREHQALYVIPDFFLFPDDMLGAIPRHAEKKDGAGQVEPFCGFANDHAESFM